VKSVVFKESIAPAAVNVIVLKHMIVAYTEPI